MSPFSEWKDGKEHAQDTGNSDADGPSKDLAPRRKIRMILIKIWKFSKYQ